MVGDFAGLQLQHGLTLVDDISFITLQYQVEAYIYAWCGLEFETLGFPFVKTNRFHA